MSGIEPVFSWSPVTLHLSSLPADHTLIYQFIPVAAVRVMERLIRSMGTRTIAMLDLEDGFWMSVM